MDTQVFGVRISPRSTRLQVSGTVRSSMRWYFAKFLELSGIALLGSALYWGIVQNSMKMEVQLLTVGSVVFAVGWFLDSREGR